MDSNTKNEQLTLVVLTLYALDTQLEAGVLIKEGEVVYDMCWYPQMSSQDPASCCVLSSSRDHPVHLWDAFTGEVSISD